MKKLRGHLLQLLLVAFIIWPIIEPLVSWAG